MTLDLNGKLDLFAVELAVQGISEEKDPSAQQDFDFELSMRPHIFDKKVIWDREKHRLLVQLVIEGINDEMTTKNMTEELFEIAAALLK
jgi:hypothetical protein